MSEALAHPGAQARDAERSRALFSLGHICNFMGKHRDGLPYLEESLSIAREIADPQLVEYVLQQLGFAWEGLGDLAGATDCYDEAIVLARRSATGAKSQLP